MTWPIYNITLEDMIGAQVFHIVLAQFWALRDISWYMSFTKKQWGHILTPKVDTVQVFWTTWVDRSDLSCIETGQTGQDKFVKLSIGLHHYVDLVEPIEMHMLNVQFGVRMRKLCLLEDPHAGLTSLSDRSRGGQTSLKCPIRVRSRILTQDLLGFRLLMGTDLPTLYI